MGVQSPLWLLSCTAVLLIVQTSCVNAACKVDTELPHGGQQCLSLLGAVDSGVSQANICTMFQEVVHCIKQRTQEDGESCDFETVRKFVVHFSSQADWLNKLHLDSCQVSEPTVSICKDAHRLTVLGSTMCGAYLKDIHGSHAVCKQASLIYESCVQQNIPHAGCTPKDILATFPCLA